MKRAPADAAFSLVEVVLALAVAAFCLVTLLGLISVGNINNSASIDQTTATSLAAAIVSDLKTTPAATGKSVRYGIPVPTSGSTVTHTLFLDEAGTLVGTMDANASTSENPVPRYRATLTFVPSSTGIEATSVRILITWPALADVSVASGPTNFTGSFDTVIGLILN